MYCEIKHNGPYFRQLNKHVDKNLNLQVAEIAKLIIDDFDKGKLEVPSLPEVISRIRDAIKDPKRGTQQIAKLIQLDPALTARLIQISNSASHRGNFTIDTCQMAITRLGLQTTRNLVTCLVMHNVFKVKSPQLHLRVRELWRQSCRVAAIAYVLAQINKGQLNPDKALLAGLIHDIGVLPVLHYAADFPEIFNNSVLLDGLIKDLRGKLGRQILRNWDFDETLIPVPEGADDWQYDSQGGLDYVDIVQVARIHSQFGSQTENVQPLPPLAELPAFQKMSIAKLGPDASVELLHEAQDEIQAMVQMLLV